MKRRRSRYSIFQVLGRGVRAWLTPKDDRKRQAGLTFIETVIVIAIIAIFATAVTITVGVVLSSSKEAAAKSQIGTFRIALEIYFMQCGNYPTPEQGLAALRTKPSIEPVPEGWKAPYLTGDVPKDPWGHDYKYLVPGPEGDPYGIVSYGLDGAEGGEGDNKDITSWD